MSARTKQGISLDDARFRFGGTQIKVNKTCNLLCPRKYSASISGRQWYFLVNWWKFCQLTPNALQSAGEKENVFGG